MVWSCTNEDVDGRFKDPCGAQRLPNGNTVIGCYGQTDAAMPRIVELTPDKEVVWEFFHPEVRAHEIHVLNHQRRTRNAHHAIATWSVSYTR